MNIYDAYDTILIFYCDSMLNIQTKGAFIYTPWMQSLAPGGWYVTNLPEVVSCDNTADIFRSVGYLSNFAHGLVCMVVFQLYMNI